MRLDGVSDIIGSVISQSLADPRPIRPEEQVTSFDVPGSGFNDNDDDDDDRITAG